MARKYLKSEIDEVVFFTLNQAVTLPNASLDYSFWIPMYKLENDTNFGNFVNELGSKFNDFYTDLTGIESTDKIITDDRKKGEELIRDMKYLPRELIFESKKK